MRLALTLGFAAACILAADEPARNPAKAAFEKGFLGMMAHHHDMGVEMAQPCLGKAVHAELKQLCQKVADTQKRESSQMRQWLQGWYGGGQAPTPGKDMDAMAREHQATMQRLNSTSGDGFDKAFLDAMTRHHQQAMPDLRACISRAEHPELTTLCKQMLAGQRREVQQMVSLARARHGAMK